MSSQHCNDCGTKMYAGVCPNCQEELYIAETQYEDIVQPLSDEFLHKVKEQKKVVQ